MKLFQNLMQAILKGFKRKKFDPGTVRVRVRAKLSIVYDRRNQVLDMSGRVSIEKIFERFQFHCVFL